MHMKDLTKMEVQGFVRVSLISYLEGFFLYNNVQSSSNVVSHSRGSSSFDPPQQQQPCSPLLPDH